MKNIIPFSKELDFKAKLSEITSISLEREFVIEDTTIEGNLIVSGEYKSHEVSANVLPFSFKIPFSIELTDQIVKDSITLEINDFAYDIVDETKIKVNIELEFTAEEKEVEEEIEKVDPPSIDLTEFMEENEEREEETLPMEETKEEEVILENITDEEQYATYHIHLVKEGETVETICTMYNSNVNLLADYNDLSQVNPGEKLIIPFQDEP